MHPLSTENGGASGWSKTIRPGDISGRGLSLQPLAARALISLPEAQRPHTLRLSAGMQGGKAA